MGVLLLTCGTVAALAAAWRAHDAARHAVAPLAHDPEPTRALVDARRPLLARTRVRRFARHAFAAVGWLAVAMYGLFLAVAGTTAVGS